MSFITYKYVVFLEYLYLNELWVAVRLRNQTTSILSQSHQTHQNTTSYFVSMIVIHSLHKVNLYISLTRSVSLASACSQ